MKFEQFRLPNIGQQAPAFKANTTQGLIHFPIDYSGRWVILMNHISDFTPVCTTEFMTLGAMTKDFEKLNCQILGVSVNGLPSHIAWLRTIKYNVEFNGMKNVEVTFPLIDDISTNISKKYGMIHYEDDMIKSNRTLFIIDPDGYIRALLQYPPCLGRNFEEVYRILIGLQVSNKFSVGLPANWKVGDDVVVPVLQMINNETEGKVVLQKDLARRDPCSNITYRKTSDSEMRKVHSHEWFLHTTHLTQEDIYNKLFGERQISE